jgi:hypothetical protein
MSGSIRKYSRHFYPGLNAEKLLSCCIDKSSSAELSEAINSMYRWYQDAAIAYAYLEDVKERDDQHNFSTSRWFRRGNFT